MNNNFIRLTFSKTDEERTGLLVAMLNEIDYSGFEETDNGLVAFINEKIFDHQRLETVLNILKINYEKSIIKEENWNAKWECAFEPIIVSHFVGIRASFHKPMTDLEHEIIITPKMSFGTGHHATTCLMIEQMSKLDFANKSVFDFGTGTGVLAILAEKMGAREIKAIDIDEWSIENSIENIKANNCSHINISRADSIEESMQYDIILANINLNIILENISAITSAAKKDGFILISGFLQEDEQRILSALRQSGLEYLSTAEKENWICICLKMN